MQTIYRATHTSSYSVLPNSIPNNTALSAHARLALIYLLGKPKDWKLRVSDLKRAIGCGINKCYRCLNELIKAGYAQMKRGQSRVDWFFYDVPQTSVDTHRDDTHHVGNGDELQSKDYLPSKEINNYTAPAKEQIENNVVVVSTGADIEPPPIPNNLKGSQAKAASKLLSNVSPEQAAMILMVFNTAVKAGKLNNPIGYLHSLVKAAQEGTLTTPESKQQLTLSERIAREKKAREQAKNSLKVDNASFFEMMRKQYGDKVAKFGMTA